MRLWWPVRLRCGSEHHACQESGWRPAASRNILFVRRSPSVGAHLRGRPGEAVKRAAAVGTVAASPAATVHLPVYVLQESPPYQTANVGAYLPVGPGGAVGLRRGGRGRGSQHDRDHAASLERRIQHPAGQRLGAKVLILGARLIQPCVVPQPIKTRGTLLLQRLSIYVSRLHMHAVLTRVPAGDVIFTRVKQADRECMSTCNPQH